MNIVEIIAPKIWDIILTDDKDLKKKKWKNHTFWFQTWQSWFLDLRCFCKFSLVFAKFFKTIVTKTLVLYKI